MNIYAIIILNWLVVSLVLEYITRILNLRAMTPELPGEFEGFFDPDAYRKSQDYTRQRCQFGLITSTCSTLIIVAFWFVGGFEILDSFVRRWQLDTPWAGMAYIGMLVVGNYIVSLPFHLYSTFVIERRFGFNRTTLATFLLDTMKIALLGIVIGGSLLAVVLLLFDFFGTWAWLYCWMATTSFTLIIQFIAPQWIMPLFNKFTPLEDGALRQAIESYAESMSFPLKHLFVIDGSRRSTKSNAYLTGFGRRIRVALFDTLIDQHTVGELLTVVAHEIGHHKKKHIPLFAVFSIAHLGVMFMLFSVVLGQEDLFDAFYVQQASIYVGLVIFSLLFAPVEFVISVCIRILSRRFEFEADRFAVETTGETEQLIDALKKLSVHNLSNLTPHPLDVMLHHSHPTVLARIRAIRAV